MPPNGKSQGLRTWVEIDSTALGRNIAAFRKVISAPTKLMAVVKSNAYGHGLWEFARATENRVDWFGVDTLAEALRLREQGIEKPILVLGYTLPELFPEAAKQGITLTVSTFENLEVLVGLKTRPDFHIKLDTGMHRQGFLANQVPELIASLRRSRLKPQGVYTHFASAKDRTYPFYTKRQIAEFNQALHLFGQGGFTDLIRHASATAGTLLHPEAHYDMVRVGIGLYGLWPSREIMLQRELPPAANPGITLEPILSWKTVVGEVKDIPAGSYIGYDLTEKVKKPTRLAVLPVGYWHGVDRRLSGTGAVLVGGSRSKILGRVSMDMIAVDVSSAGNVKPGDEAVLIGRQGPETISAYDWAELLGTSHYEIVTRINPLIKRIYG